MVEMSNKEVGKINIREEEEVGIGISTCEERIVEVEGTYTWKNEICEDVEVVWDVWGIDETHSANTDGSLEVSSRLGFKFK